MVPNLIRFLQAQAQVGKISYYYTFLRFPFLFSISAVLSNVFFIKKRFPFKKREFLGISENFFKRIQLVNFNSIPFEKENLVFFR